MSHQAAQADLRIRDSDQSLDLSAGLSLLLVRPQLLLSSLHYVVILLALRLNSEAHNSSAIPASLEPRFRALRSANNATAELFGELQLNQEVMEKVRVLEGKLEYQIKKLVGLVTEEAKAIDVEGACDARAMLMVDPLCFRPNPSAIVSRERRAEATGVYRPPRVAAVPYTEATKRKERRAPALLSEFATTIDGAPGLESTSGLSTRPVSTHTNSTSAKRVAELDRINRFEEENMTRLVTTKREAKRRREDEAALALGYGVGGPRRRKNGLEAELEGVLGERRSKGVWEKAGELGKGEGVIGRQRDVQSRRKRARFEKDLGRRGDV